MWSGVDLFFVLSGFLIGGILLDHRMCSNYFQVFYIRRICRILPLYFSLLFLYLMLSRHSSPSYAWLFADPLPIWSYLTFTQNYLVSGFDQGGHWLGITWSLAVEEQFYLGLPLLIRFASTPVFLLMSTTLVLLAPVMRFWVGDVGAFAYTFCRTDSVFIGVLLAWFYRNRRFIEFLRQNRVACWGALSIMITLTSFALLAAYGLGGIGNHFWFAILYGIFLILIVVFAESRLAGIIRNRCLVWLGIRSYFIYLAHQAVSGLLHGALFGAEPKIDSWFHFVVTMTALIVVLFLASASYRYFELPFLCYGRKFLFRDDRLNASH
jgi:peptidoglycan/LPS O-acetylase OafA/YrhL